MADQRNSSTGIGDNSYANVDDPELGLFQTPEVLGNAVLYKLQQLHNRLEDVARQIKYRIQHPSKLNSKVAFKKTKHSILEGINLRFESGKMYLVLGGACSGKSTLLKAIAGILQVSET